MDACRLGIFFGSTISFTLLDFSLEANAILNLFSIIKDIKVNKSSKLSTHNVHKIPKDIREHSYGSVVSLAFIKGLNLP